MSMRLELALLWKVILWSYSVQEEYGCPSISQAVQSYFSKDRCSVYAKISTSKDSGISISTKYPRISVAVSTQA